MKTDSQCVADFEAYLLTEKRVSTNTFLAYQLDIKQFITFLLEQKSSIALVNKTLFSQFLGLLKKAGLSARSMARKISTFKAFFKFLHERYDMPNRAAILIFPKIKKNLPKYLTPEELEQLFKVANRDSSQKGVRNKVMLSLLYASGMRISELLATKVGDVDFKTGFVYVIGKGNKERFVPLPQSILSLLSNYLATVHRLYFADKAMAQDYLFISSKHKQTEPMTRQAFWIILKKLLATAHITKDISPHSLRHSLATHLLKNGANLRALQLLLGHESVVTVQVYTHLENSQLRQVYDKKHPRA